MSNIRRFPIDPVLFAERFLINPDTGTPFDLLDDEREFLRTPRFADFAGRLSYLNAQFTCRTRTLQAIYLITTAVMFRDSDHMVMCGSCEDVNRDFEETQRIVESSPLLRATAIIAPGRIMIGASVLIDHNRLYDDIEG
jgi:hypothetical protein